ncbi:transglycosylase [Pseudorhizobium endolithicum]|uniref:peptidoglycan lytic exotransglycosylase n=1 Tax=Pseudorhizobium endolithicum TaxID=1191678 RepID=A0ABN7JZZ1_9HYPH|nr:murein transglycosylase A [Pseudorhizobium endolithicum]CAD7049269.1 transglycosylase [Pseudorhizobium endolithicum]
MTSILPEFFLTPVAYGDLPGWEKDDPGALLVGMRRCLDHVTSVKAYRNGSLGLTTEDILPAYQAASREHGSGSAAARGFFERNFRPFLIRRSDGKRGFVTAFYEPEIEVSPFPTDVWAYPFYRRPHDLVDLDDKSRPADLDPSYMFGRLQDGEIAAYPDRRAIDGGYLEGRGLEIAWARSKVDVFFAHVQGAARLRFPDGSLRRITYAAKAGHPFSAIGKLLIDRGEIGRETVSMQTIRAWLERNPASADEVLWHNRSYIFFREAEVEDPALGPVAAAKVPLLPGRSLAVDRLIHTFGFPFFIHSPTLTHLDGGRPFARALLALDTGSAIVGPDRGDIFTGSGDAAGELAGTVRDDADFYILIPHAAAARFGG